MPSWSFLPCALSAATPVEGSLVRKEEERAWSMA